MEFEVETVDYSVAELHDNFAHKLPLVVMVNQGFCGDIIEDTFDREQIIRLHTVSRQKRVIAKSQHAGQLKLCSIPLTYAEPLCVLNKKQKHGKEKTITSIIKKYNLPLEVQFPRDRHISVGNQTISTNHIPSMELTECFDEMYILGNLITDGVLSQDVIEVPLYLSKLRLVICTGIKGQSREKWAGFQEGLTRICSAIEYNQEYGNPNIAVYHPESIHSDTAYAYVEPSQYSSFFQMFKRPMDVPQETDGNVYELIQEGAQLSEKEKGKSTFSNKTYETKRPLPSPQAPEQTTDAAKPPPPIQPKPMALIEEMKKNFETPAVPDRKRNVQESFKKPKTPNIYSNDIPRGPVAPMTTEKKVNTANPEQNVKPRLEMGVAKTKEKTATIEPVKELKDASDVAKLNIDEISEYLRKLRLEKYVQVFVDNLVDGTILCELDKSILQESFGLNTIESIRLMKFIKSGHIPI